MQREELIESERAEPAENFFTKLLVEVRVEHHFVFAHLLSYVVEQLRVFQTIACVSRLSNTLFKPVIDTLLKPLGEELVLKTALGDVARVKALLQVASRLVLIPATVQDYSYRTLENKVALQVAYGANNFPMFDLILSAYAKIPNGMQTAREHLKAVMGKPPEPYNFYPLLNALSKANEEDVCRAFTFEITDRPLDQALQAFRAHFSRRLAVESQHFNMDDLLCVLEWGANHANSIDIPEEAGLPKYLRGLNNSNSNSNSDSDSAADISESDDNEATDTLKTPDGTYFGSFEGAAIAKAIFAIFDRTILAFLYRQLPAHYAAVLGAEMSDKLDENIKACSLPQQRWFYPLIEVVGERMGLDVTCLGVKTQFAWTQGQRMQTLLQGFTKLHKYHVDQINIRLFELGLTPDIQKEAGVRRRV